MEGTPISKRLPEIDSDTSPHDTRTEKIPNLNRTPQKMTEGKNDMLVQIQQMFTEQDKRMSDQFNAQREETIASEERVKKAVAVAVNELEVQLDIVKKDNAALREVTSQMGEKIKSLQGRLIQTERDARRLNFVASGVEFNSPQEGYEKLQHVINKYVEKPIRISGLRTIKLAKGKKIVAACDNIADKSLLMRSEENLSVETDGQTNKIFIDHDKPFEDRESDRQTRLAAKEYAAKGKDVRYEAGKLKVDGMWMRFNPDTKEVEPFSFRK